MFYSGGASVYLRRWLVPLVCLSAMASQVDLRAADPPGPATAVRGNPSGPTNPDVTARKRAADNPLAVDPAWTEEQRLSGSDTSQNPYAFQGFGSSLSLSGDTALIGTSNGYSGFAYVFVRNGSGAWVQQKQLFPPDYPALYQTFGSAVSVSGNTAVIGAPLGNGAYVFVGSPAGTWDRQQTLSCCSIQTQDDDFGESVAVSGGTLAVGAPATSTAATNYAGATYVFVRDSSGNWSHQQMLTATDGASYDSFGWSIALSGNTLAIGASGHNNGQGAVYVFVENASGSWNLQQEIIASDGAASDAFGGSVSLSGDTALIGASGKNSSQGAAYVFHRSGVAWSQQQELAASDGLTGNQFGTSIAVNGSTAIIGAIHQGTHPTGAAYVFASNMSGNWVQQQELTATDDEGSLDSFGSAVALSGNTAMVGATNSGNGGAVYVFANSGLTPNTLQVGSAAGTSSVTLYTQGAWTATANDPFLHISPESATGSGSSLVTFSYDAFTATGARTGTLTIAGLTFTVTQAGTNYTGPGWTATLVSSGLSDPSGVAVDGSGNVYFADAGDNLLKQWSPTTQQVTTTWSVGLSSPSGVAADAFGNIYFTDSGHNSIDRWNAAQGFTTLVSSGLSSPSGIAVDGSGNVYFADIGNNAIKQWNMLTQEMTTLASSVLNNPSGVALDRLGNVYFPDAGSDAIKRWSVATQQVTTLVSGLNNPTGLAVDGSGNVYFADTGNNAIREWSASTQQLTTLVSAGLNRPSGVAVDGFGNVYFSDAGNNAVKEIPWAFVSSASLSEPASVGSDSLTVLPSTASLSGIFAPTSDQSWLSIGGTEGGVINFFMSENTSGSARVAHITVLGQQVTVTQNPPSNVIFTASPNPIVLSGGAASGTTTLSWNAPGHSQVAVFVNSTDGQQLTGWLGPTGSATTGDWVNNGMEFFLVDQTSGAIARLTVRVESAGISEGPRNPR
jgi:streptogramin lyase